MRQIKTAEDSDVITITMLDQPFAHMSKHDYQQLVGYLMQDPARHGCAAQCPGCIALLVSCMPDVVRIEIELPD